MTDDEIFQVFNTHRNAVPAYELGSINYVDHQQHNSGLRTKRSVGNKKISFRAFGEDVELILEPNDNVLYGNATPLYIASYDGQKFTYERKPFVSLSFV